MHPVCQIVHAEDNFPSGLNALSSFFESCFKQIGQFFHTLLLNMFGLLQSLASMASIAYPLYRTITQLTALQSSRNNALTALTDTIPLYRKDAELLQESLTYWIVLAFWFYFTQITPIAILLKILPLSSLAILYFQIWLGFPIIPLANNVKVSGAFVIYHYYYDNNMRNLTFVKSKFTSGLGILGVYICELVKRLPSSDVFFRIAGVNVDSYEKYFKEMSSPSDKRSAQENIASAVFGNGNAESKIGGISQYLTSFVTGSTYSSTVPEPSRGLATANAENKPPQQAANDYIRNTDTTFILSSLFAPFGYNLEGAQVAASASSSSFASVVSQKDSKTPSPTRSFDDFAIVSEKDLLEGSDLSGQMYKAKRANKSKDRLSSKGNDSPYNSSTSSFEPKRQTSNLSDVGTVIDETSGLLAPELSKQSSTVGKKATSRSGSRSSWFRTSSRG